MTDRDSAVAIDGEWVNDGGSKLVIRERAGAVSGIYRTALGAADRSREYPLVGWRNGRCLGFTVSWGPESDSVTAWTALLHGDPDPELHAVWTLVRSSAFGKRDDVITERATAPWEAFSIQSSRFRRRQSSSAGG